MAIASELGNILYFGGDAAFVAGLELGLREALPDCRVWAGQAWEEWLRTSGAGAAPCAVVLDALSGAVDWRGRLGALRGASGRSAVPVVLRCPAEPGVRGEAFRLGADAFLGPGEGPAELAALLRCLRRPGGRLDDPAALEVERLARIIDTMPDAILAVDEDKRVVAWNRASERLTGVARADILGQDSVAVACAFYGYGRPILLDLFGPQPRVDRGAYDLVDWEGDVARAEVQSGRIRGGRGGRCLCLAAPILDARGAYRGAIEIVRDVTDLRLAESELSGSEAKYRELVEHANSIILRWSRDGRITFMNGFGLRFFGYTSEELLGRHVVGSIVPERDSAGADLRGLMERICADPVAFETNQNENLLRDGRRVWVAWTNRIVRDGSGRIEEIQSVGTDITPLQEAHAAIQALNRDLEDRVRARTAELSVALERAREADRVKSAFLATMSHELRTPLNSILGFSGVLLKDLAGPLNPEQRRQLEMVRSSGRHLLNLSNDILDISKIEAGQMEVDTVPFRPRPALERVLEMVRPEAEAKGLGLTARLPAADLRIPGDERRFSQVVLNLLHNAVKFTDSGWVRLDASLEASAGAPGPRLRVAVLDTGLGIAPADLPLLFQAFRQLETGLSRRKEGTGLGLAISRKLARLMGGDVTVGAREGGGSVFTLDLPAEGGMP